MTTTIKQHKTEHYYIVLELDKYGVYIVEACPLYRDGCAGYPVSRMTYAPGDKKNALATYRRYIRKYSEV